MRAEDLAIDLSQRLQARQIFFDIDDIPGETYEVFGPAGAVANISYFDANSEPTFVKGASLPWSLNFEITETSAVGSLLAQGDSDSIGCRILVDDEVKAEKISNQFNAFTSCLLKAA